MKNRLLYWNANGITSRFDDLESLLTQPRADHRIAAVAIVESKLDIHTRDNPPSVHGYTSTSIPFTKHSGGILFMVDSNLPSRHLAAYDYVHHRSPTAVSCMLIQMPTNTKPTLFIAVYIHPQTTANTLTALLSHMNRIVQHHVTHDIVIVGDFNSRHPVWGDSCATRTAPRIVDFLTATNLITLNQIYMPHTPTRPSSGTIIDLVITNRPHIVSDVCLADDMNLRSDHHAILTTLSHHNVRGVPTAPRSHTTVAVRTNWHTNNVVWPNFTERLTANVAPWNTAGMRTPDEVTTAQSIVDTRWDELRSIIIATAQSIVPVRRQGTVYARWWSYPHIDMNALHKKLRAAIRQYIRGGRRPYHYAVLVNTRKDWRKAYKAAHEWEWMELCEHIESRPHVLSWSHWRRLQARTRRRHLNNIADVDGNLPRTPRESLNNFMQSSVKCSIPSTDTPLRSAVELHVDISLLQYTNDPTIDSVHWSCTVDEVERACSMVDVTGAQGCDNIHPAFVKHGGPALHKALHMLYQYSYRHAVIPLQWTRAIISPIYKGGDTSSANSYRPISVTCIPMRIMERLIQPRLMSLVDHRLHPFQYGFRPNHSTQHAVYHLLNDLRQYVRTKPRATVPVAFIDLVKAFDRVWRDGLLYQLSQQGITGRMWLWLHAFLRNRYVSVASGNDTSDWYAQHYGVPQGAVLSPLLFSIYVDSCARMINANSITRYPNSSMLSFADDGAILPNVHDKRWQHIMQTCLDILASWALLWQQEIHPTKTVIVQFQRTHTRLDNTTELPDGTKLSHYSLNGKAIHLRTSFKYLGVHLDANLNWASQCEHMQNRMLSDAHRIRSITHYKTGRPVHFSTIYKLCVSYLMPRWAYGLAFITNVSTRWLQQLQSQLCSVLRYVLRLPSSTHLLSVLIDAALLPIAIYREFDVLRLANSMRALPPQHNARQILELDYASAVIDNNDWVAIGQQSSLTRSRREPMRIHSLGRTILEIEQKWQLSHTDDIRIIRNTARQRAMQLWAQDISQHSILFQLKLQWGPSYHLYMDTAANARLRARFRHNRVYNNYIVCHLTQQRHHLLITHPYCPICPTTQETIQHMIEECPLYAWPRLQLKWQLLQLQIDTDITVQLVLGIHIRSTCWTDRTKRGLTRLMLLHTANYLRYICCLRFLVIP
jgi:hypothetical protein